MITIKAVATSCFFAMLLPALDTQSNVGLDQGELRRETREQVEGNWKLKVDRVGQGVSFNVFMSFAAGGVVVATGSLDKLESVSTVFGSWQRITRERVDVTIYFFLFDPAGNPVGTLKTNETIHLDGKNKLTGTGSSYTCDVAAENCGDTPVGQVRFTGTRLLVESLTD